MWAKLCFLIEYLVINKMLNYQKKEKVKANCKYFATNASSMDFWEDELTLETGNKKKY